MRCTLHGRATCCLRASGSLRKTLYGIGHHGTVPRIYSMHSQENGMSGLCQSALPLRDRMPAVSRKLPRSGCRCPTNTRSLPSENTSNGAATVAIPFRSICAPCTPFIIEPGGAAMLRHTVTPSGRYRSNRPEPRNWPYPEACCEPLPAGISGRAN